MRIAFERDLPCSVEQAFAWVSVPERMNRWSRATVSCHRPGDGPHPGGLGAVRTVRLAQVGTPVLWEIVDRSEPPHVLGYEVFEGSPFTSHRGLVTLEPARGGTALRWEMAFEGVGPGWLQAPRLGGLVRRFIEPEVRRSLDTLVIVAKEQGPVPSLPPPRDLSEPGAMAALYVDAERVRREQESTAADLRFAEDPLYWFAQAYQFVTEGTVAACRASKLVHPAWALRLVPCFHRYFIENLRAFLGDGDVEAHWQAAFSAARKPEPSPFLQMTQSVVHGVRAHLEEDLPRVLAEVYVRDYQGRADYARFRGDYYALGHVLEGAGERLLREVPTQGVPKRVRALRGLFPKTAVDRAVRGAYDDLPTKRRQAFERGERLVRLLGRKSVRPPSLFPGSTGD
ncbi:MAG: SRPBCC family protein [Myxococcales bacterium]|nr:SRPBCC family protein [Myxococcales bacterium]